MLIRTGMFGDLGYGRPRFFETSVTNFCTSILLLMVKIRRVGQRSCSYCPEVLPSSPPWPPRGYEVGLTTSVFFPLFLYLHTFSTFKLVGTPRRRPWEKYACPASPPPPCGHFVPPLVPLSLFIEDPFGGVTFSLPVLFLPARSPAS